ncbi:MAG: Acidobacterial duplicated orphan permease (function unknown), partial [uncultured Gemmatimonadetes bacterium]
GADRDGNRPCGRVGRYAGYVQPAFRCEHDGSCDLCRGPPGAHRCRSAGQLFSRPACRARRSGGRAAGGV